MLLYDLAHSLASNTISSAYAYKNVCRRNSTSKPTTETQMSVMKFLRHAFSHKQKSTESYITNTHTAEN